VCAGSGSAWVTGGGGRGGYNARQPPKQRTFSEVPFRQMSKQSPNEQSEAYDPCVSLTVSLRRCVPCLPIFTPVAVLIDPRTANLRTRAQAVPAHKAIVVISVWRRWLAWLRSGISAEDLADFGVEDVEA